MSEKREKSLEEALIELSNACHVLWQQLQEAVMATPLWLRRAVVIGWLTLLVVAIVVSCMTGR